MPKFHPTTTTYKQGAIKFSRDYFTSESILKKELKKIFFNNWVRVERTSSLRNSGDYITVDVVGEPIIIIRDLKGNNHALFNTCRHLGTRISMEECRHYNYAIQCDYNA